MAQEDTQGLKKEAAEAKASKKLDYVMVQYLASSPHFRTHRAVRAADRKPKFILGNGTQIRDKGSRYTEVTFKDVLSNFEKLLKGIIDGTIAVCRPDNLQAFTAEQFADLGSRLAEDFKVDLKVNQTVLEPLTANLQDKKTWVETAPQEKAPAAAPAVVEEPAPAQAPAEAPVEEKEEELTEAQMLEMSVKDLQKLAKDYGVKNASGLNKKDLVDAIIAAASKEQE